MLRIMRRKLGTRRLEVLLVKPDGSRLQGRIVGYRTPSHAFGPRLSLGSLGLIDQNIVDIRVFIALNLVYGLVVDWLVAEGLFSSIFIDS